ncbi:MAG TPA: TRAP transporter permease [Pseudolabrys sp.]|nr:TRAP transporter permease [Pseudolabrys sp.]
MTEKDGQASQPSDEGTVKRDLVGGWRTLFQIGVLLASGFHLYTGAFGLFASHVQVTVHWALISSLILILYHSKNRSSPKGQIWLDLFLALGGIATNLYIILTIDDRVLGVGILTVPEIILAGLAVLIVLETARRTTGIVLPLTCIVLMLYALFGNHLPSLVAHRGFDLNGLLGFLYLSTEGIYSLPLGISASYIILFILFGALLNLAGGGRFFTEVAYAAAGTLRGGPAKTAVLSSALMGMISGSPVANVMTVGSFTIPLMTSTGVRGVMAAAIEAVASTGGSIMPPIMGAAAFIMAEYLNVPYRDVAIAATIPAVLYYVTLYWMVDLEAAKEGLVGLPREKLPRLQAVLTHSGHLIIPVVAMVAALLYGWSPLKAAFASIVLLFVVAIVRANTRPNMRPAMLLKALESGIVATMPVASACAAAGIIVGVLSLTGLGPHFASVMSSIAGNSLPVALILTMIAAVILGCGMPVSAVYLIMASLTAPALIRLGLTPLAAHMFIFYFSCIAAITPPVALAAYAAAGIARANPHSVGIAAVKIGIVAFVVPYMFAYAPTLLMQGSFIEVGIDFCAAVFGTYLISVGIQGHSFLPHNKIERAVAIVGGLLLIKPGLTSDLVGLLAAVFVAALVWMRSGKLHSVPRAK